MKRGLLYVLVSLSLFLSCGRNTHDNVNELRADSLCMGLSNMRYSDISLFDSLALELSFIANENELQMIATNAMAYASMMQMDYNRAVELYRYVRDNSNCEIERLVADVGLMIVCYRISANRLFFDYRTSALSRIKRINEENDFLSLSEKERFNRAKVEFGIVSVCYFSNLAMNSETDKVFEYLEQNIEDVDDNSLRLYARMMLGKKNPDLLNRLSQWVVGLSIAENNNIAWLEGNYKLLLSISLRDSNTLQKFLKEHPEKFSLLLPKDASPEELPSILAHEAAESFYSYGDEYMIIEALSVEASCYTREENYNEALSVLSNAYLKITDYYQNKYPNSDLADLDSLLYSMDNAAGLITDVDAGIYHIPECLLSVCREASCAYAGLGDKVASDINRNLYLDLLRTTRLNKHLESRVSTIEERVERLRTTAIIALLFLIALSLFLFLVHRRRMIKENSFSMQRKKLLKVCRILFSSLPNDIDNKKQLFDAISLSLNKNMDNFSGKTHFAISETSCENPYEYSSDFYIRYINSEDCDKLTISSEYPLDADKISLIAMLIPYIAVAIEEGMRLSDISDEREKVEEMKRASEIYLAEHKRENILKRVSVSIVSGMRTFMDRISNELKNLTGEISPKDVERKLMYISELTDKLGDLNLILERWIKTRNGEVNLRIENFNINDLFAIIEKNSKIFEARELSLMVKPSNSVVKADKALTLFMINTLVDNAAKFTPSGGSVILESIEGDGFVEIAITDSGIGMSQDDIERILGAEVYDASLIGEDNELLKPKSKGSGFGLMNCKGIIEKYKKTDSYFSQCSFDISSTKGSGSRFSFRLPKGLQRCILLLLSFLPINIFANDNIFEKINEYADSVYMCNINGNHRDAFVVAEKALNLLNTYYKTETGGCDTLSVYTGKTSELSWWRNTLFQDSLKEYIYYNILDIRNEVAVASLALKKWDSYNYNNNIYSTLYRLVHEDKDVAEYYAKIEQVANNYEVAIAFSCFLILLLFIYYTITFLRHNIIEKTNERLVLEMNNRLLSVTTRNGKRTVADLAQDIVDELYTCLGETMCIKEISLLLSTDEINEQKVVFSPSEIIRDRGEMYMQRVLDSGNQMVLLDGTMRIMPLYAINGSEKISVGVLEIVTERPLSENEIVSLELITNYLASVAYHSAVRVASGYIALEELEDEAERMSYEENRLHVQNMVMDNCLSVIKHETVYYPNRIKELAGQALLSIEDNKVIVSDMCELMEYYSSVFGILCNCAIRELDGTSFRLKKIELSLLFEKAKLKAERMMRKMGVEVDIIYEKSNTVVCVDADLVDFLFEQLFVSAFKIKKGGTITLRAFETEELVKVEFVDNRYEITNDEAAELFTPTKRNINNSGSVNAMEYLAAKEIVRLHEDYTGKHGGRMEARSDISGTIILFTLPK